MVNGHSSHNRIHILKPAPSLPDSGVRDHPSEIGTVRLEAKIEVLEAEIKLWRERCHYKNEMLLDEAAWLQEKLDLNESEARDAVRRRISRLRGAAFRYEKRDGGL